MEDKIKERVLQLLQMAEDYIEGEFSGIPFCCVREFVENKRIYNTLRKSVSDENRLKLDKFQYVPCDACLEKCRPKTLKRGFSEFREPLGNLMNKIYYSGKTKPLKRGLYEHYRRKTRRVV